VSGYVERLVASSLACCTWEQRTAAAWEQRVVPDACVDLIWSGERLTIAGPDTRARLVALAPDTRIVGVRLRPGVAGKVFGLPAGELQDAAPDAADVLGHDHAEALLGALLRTAGAGDGGRPRAEGAGDGGRPRAAGAGADPYAIPLDAIEAGYADQTHMTAEVTHLAGIPPVRFFKDRTPTAA